MNIINLIYAVVETLETSRESRSSFPEKNPIVPEEVGSCVDFSSESDDDDDLQFSPQNEDLAENAVSCSSGKATPVESPPKLALSATHLR
jgi:hypothetical protein